MPATLNINAGSSLFSEADGWTRWFLVAKNRRKVARSSSMSWIVAMLGTPPSSAPGIVPRVVAAPGDGTGGTNGLRELPDGCVHSRGKGR